MQGDGYSEFPAGPNDRISGRRRALLILEELTMNYSGEPGYLYDLAMCHLAWGMRFEFRNSDRVAHLRRSVALFGTIEARFPKFRGTGMSVSDVYAGLRFATEQSGDFRPRDYHSDWAQARLGLARLLEVEQKQGRASHPEESEAQYRESVAVCRKGVADSQRSLGGRVSFANAAHELGAFLLRNKRPQESIEILREALATLEFPGVERYEARGTWYAARLRTVTNGLADSYAATSRPDNAESVVRDTIRFMEGLDKNFQDAAGIRDQLTYLYGDLGRMLEKANRSHDAARAFRGAVLCSESLVADFPHELNPTIWARGALHDYARVIEACGDLSEAETALRKAVSLAERGVALTTPHPGEQGFPAKLPELLESLGELARFLSRRRSLSSAEDAYRKCLDLSQRYEVFDVRLRKILNDYAGLLNILGRPDDARAIWARVLDGEERWVASAPQDPGRLNALAWSLATHPAPGFRDPGRAVRLAREAVNRSPGAAPWNTLGVALYRAGDWKAAIEALEKSEALEPGKHLAFNGFFLAMAHMQRGDRNRARDDFERSELWLRTHPTTEDEELPRFHREARGVLEGYVEPMPEGPDAFAL
jgi:tetratricopeptide (TPR) repeat protein